MNEDREDLLDLSGEADFIDDVKEIDMTFRDHRADDDFEKMLAELNGGKKNKAEPSAVYVEPADDSIAAALAAKAEEKKLAEEQARIAAEQARIAAEQAKLAEEQARREAELAARQDMERRKREAAAARKSRPAAKKRSAAPAAGKPVKKGAKPVAKAKPASKPAEPEVKSEPVKAETKPVTAEKPEVRAEKPSPKPAAQETEAEKPESVQPVQEVKAADVKPAAEEVKPEPAKAEEPAAEAVSEPAKETPAAEDKPAETVTETAEAAEEIKEPAAEASGEAEEKSSKTAETADETAEAAEEGAEAVPAMAAVAVPVGGVKMGGALAVSGASQKKQKKQKPKSEKKEPELSEAEQKELKRKAEEAHRLEMERLEKEREKRLIESIANIWQSPDFSAGGRVEMNIKTEQRKEIHVTVPPGHEERVKAQREAERLAEQAKADAQRRNTEEEARIAAANAALEQMEEPEIPAELLKKPKPKPAAKQVKAKKPAPKPGQAAKPAKAPAGTAVKAAGAVASAAPKAAGAVAKPAAKAAETAAKTAGTAAKTAVAAAAAKEDLEATKIRSAAEISAAIAASAASAIADEERTREMSAVVPVIKKETPEERRKRREAAEAALKANEEKESAKEKTRGSKPSDKSKKSAKKKAGDKAVATVGGKYAIGNIVACCAIFFGIGVFLIVCKRESGFIQSENRNLAEKPTLSVATLLDGSYFEDITKWYTDTIPGREQLKPFSSGFEKLFGVTFNNVKITGDITPVKKETLDPELNVTTTTVTLNTDFTKKTSDDSADSSDSAAETTKKTTKKKKQTSEELAEVPAELDDGEWIGNVVVSGKGKSVRAMSAFYGQFSMGEKYAETINKYREDLGSGINIYTMNMPSSSAYYMPKNLADSFTSQQDCITNIGNNLAGIINIDTYSTLESHKDEYIYSRTDHHWQPLGAYYASKVFASVGAFDSPDLTTYDEYKIEDFVGTMYAYSNYDEELKNNPDTFIYHKPDNTSDLTVTNYDRSFSGGVTSQLFFDYASGVNCYSAILGTDDQITEIETGENTGRTLVIIKDSFGNALVPYLTHGFDKIYVIDFRYFNLNAIDFIQDVEATDLLFAVSLAAAHTESHINAIGNLRIQSSNADEELPDVVVPDVVIPGDDDGGNEEATDQ